MCRLVLNRFRVAEPRRDAADCEFLNAADALAFHRTLPGYEPTPLVGLPRAARELGIGALFVKDESRRFGLKAFKALGASYAMHRWLAQNPAAGPLTFCAATDGNHGRAVAWTARRLGHSAVVYMPADSAPARVADIRAERARVVLVEGTFDDCVRRCAEDAKALGMQAVSDTAYPGYVDIPRWILLGYQTIFRELEGSLHQPAPAGPRVDLVVLQAGVGGLAAAGAAYYARRYGGSRPRLVCVEPLEAACCLESAEAGERRPASGSQRTIMAGLSCGEVSPVAWPILRDVVDVFVSVSDAYAEEAMRLYAREGIVSGESGAAGLAALISLTRSPGLRAAGSALGLGSRTRALALNTEGDTDPEGYRRVVGRTSLEVSQAGGFR